MASNPGGSAIWLRGASPQLVCLKITSPNATARSSDNNAHGVTIDNAQNFMVDHVLVDGVAGAGIFNGGGDNGRITSNVVRNSLADGIHNTGSASFVTIAFNQVQNAGDDFIAVVSYVELASQVHDVSITDNRVSSQPWGRGVTVAGGYNVSILRNSIESCFGACIYIASEPGTYDVDNVQASSNFVRAPDRGNIHQANVLVWCGASGRHVAGVSGANNNLDRAEPMIRKVAQSDCTFGSVTVSGFYGD
jgi:hypothetical protein